MNREKKSWLRVANPFSVESCRGGPLYVRRRHVEQRWRAGAEQGGQRLDGRQLGHFTRVGSAASAVQVVVDGVAERPDEVVNAGAVGDVQTCFAQPLAEVVVPRGQHHLDEEPDGMRQPRVAARLLQALDRGFRRGRGDGGHVAALGDEGDHASPRDRVRRRPEISRKAGEAAKSLEIVGKNARGQEKRPPTPCANSCGSLLDAKSDNSPRGTLFVTILSFANAVSACSNECCRVRVPLGGFQVGTVTNSNAAVIH
jgi:hypothetical protein